LKIEETHNNILKTIYSKKMEKSPIKYLLRKTVSIKAKYSK